jgi:hypothetical protein
MDAPIRVTVSTSHLKKCMPTRFTCLRLQREWVRAIKIEVESLLEAELTAGRACSLSRALQIAIDSLEPCPPSSGRELGPSVLSRVMALE